ncbi:MAG: AraC family transcriptional regulator [Bacteroidota bacterium]|nr:AraC family transcriptional regulator [Bacteroidota bacterium]
MKETHSLREINVKDHALIRSYTLNESKTFDFEVDSLEIYLICVRQGQVRVQASFIPHSLELNLAEAIFLAFPKESWTLHLSGNDKSEFYVVKLEVSTLHKMINPAFDANALDHSSRMNMRDLMRLIPVGPAMMICFDQVLHHKLQPPFHELFERAKFFEIFSLLLESAFGNPMEACPVAMSPGIETKLNLVRRHIIQHPEESPDPDKLAVMFELPRNTLKEGYRYKYGKTIHQYHADHKLESAMQMLNEGELLVKEVAFRIGYQNPSHFISAFKKKFGYTPKQYLKRETATASS